MSQPGEIRYAPTKDGIDIAYQVVGDGPIDLVFVSGFISHLDMNREFPFYRSIEAMSQVARLVMFDKRGTGLSDRSLGFGSLEDRMDDIRAVMDAAGVESAALYGVSEGGPLALLYAATYPHRVSKVVVYGSVARSAWAPDWPTGLTPDRIEDVVTYLSEHWGTGHALRVFIQGVPDDELDVLARFERNACTRHMVEEIMRRNLEIDIRPMLPAVGVPTLVLHNAKDPAVRVEHGRHIAEHVPGARYVEGSGAFHTHWDVANTRWIVDAILEFLGETARPEATERILQTVLFTDIVGSTDRAVEVGDAEWKKILDRHDDSARRSVEGLGGRVVKTTGDGVLAVFDGPSRAVECAGALQQSVEPLGITIRAGVHTGEVERRGDDVGGLGVHIAARVAALAGSGEVLVSRTVRDLTMGSRLRFEERGPHALKGVPGEWELFSVMS